MVARCLGELRSGERLIVAGRAARTWVALSVAAAVVVAVGIGIGSLSGQAVPPVNSPAAFGAPSGATAASTAAGQTMPKPSSAVVALDAPRFVEEALAAGLEHAYEGDFEYLVGGGVAVFDCDEDDRSDAYIAGGSAPAALFRNESEAGGSMRFSRLADAATDLEAVTGAYPLDVDGDGLTDLVVLRRGENVLLRGLGGCRFERGNESWGFDGGDQWTTAFSASWEEDTAGWPTLAFGNYLDEASDDNERLCFDNELWRPAAGGGYSEPAVLSPGWCSLSMLFSDWDRSGRRDLRVSNDRHYYGDYSPGQEQLWRVEAGTPPRLYTDEDGWRPLRIWGMGIASHDVNGDGYPEYYLTSQGDNKLQALADGSALPAYSDIALLSGTTAHRPFAGGETLPSTAWHAEFDDVNNDGLMDLFVAKGNVEAQAGYASRDPNNLLLGQVDGTFAESAGAAGIVHYARTRGAALVDFNGDGLLDLLEVNRRANVTLWRNVGAGTADEPQALGNWLAVRARQPGSNVDGVGAWVQVRVGERMTEREVVVGGGHAGGQLGPIHFGLGAATSAEVRVIWPDGEEGPWLSFDANQLVEVER